MINPKEVPSQKGYLKAPKPIPKTEYRGIIIFSNKNCGSKGVVRFLTYQIYEQIPYQEMYDTLESMGYKVNKNLKWDDKYCDGDGIFDDVIKQYQEDNNLEKARIAIRTVLSFRPIMRVLTENVPQVLLLEMLQCLNYYQVSALLVYRRSSVERLLQNHDDNNDIDKLIEDEKKCREANLYTWKYLQKYNSIFASVTSEDLYFIQCTPILMMTFQWICASYIPFMDYHVNFRFTFIREHDIIVNKSYLNDDAILISKKLEELGERPTFANMHILTSKYFRQLGKMG